MRNIQTRRTIIMVIAALALVLAAGAYITVPKGITQLKIVTAEGDTVVESLEMYVGTEKHIECKIEPAAFKDRKAEYSISDETIATIDSAGRIKALKEGETVLTVVCADVRKNYKIKAEAAVEAITGLEKEITLYEGDEYQLEPKIRMAEKGLEKPAITYKVKRKTIATVDNEGLVTAVSEGSTTVTVTAGDTSEKVKVNVESSPVVVSTPAVTVDDDADDNDDNNKKTTKKKTKKKTGGNTGGGGDSSGGGGNTGGDNTGGDSSGGDSSGGGGDSSGGGSSEGGSGSGSGSDSGSTDSGE